MKGFAFAATVFVALLAVSECRVLADSENENIQPFSVIDPIIKNILEKMRPKIANLKIDDINQVVKNPNINATFIANEMIIKNLDKFVIRNLKSNVVPLKLVNLTLTWDEIDASAFYDFIAKFNIPRFTGPFKIHGKGNARAILKDVFFTIGANMEMKNKAVQIKPKGLFGFDLMVKSANVTMTSMMGSTEFGKALGVFLSKIIPDLVLTLKKPVFYSFQDDIIRILNEILRKQGSYSGMPFENEDTAEFLEPFLFESSEESD